jgi:hypothetical protein
MTLGETLISAWQQALVYGKSAIALDGKTYSVGSTRAKRLRTVRFEYADYQMDIRLGNEQGLLVGTSRSPLLFMG